MGLKQMLQECIPPAYYSNGIEAKCMWFRVFNMFDIDPQSYIVDEKKKDMEKTIVTPGTVNLTGFKVEKIGESLTEVSIGSHNIKLDSPQTES